mmetsp:Transcript_56584/g.157670  ORF Transcript_56584/g.157670 Transcript_56584/m.157670 type:complete len:94 (-) Transcript_56584:331-612(-)
MTMQKDLKPTPFTNLCVMLRDLSVDKKNALTLLMSSNSDDQVWMEPPAWQRLVSMLILTLESDFMALDPGALFRSASLCQDLLRTRPLDSDSS